MSNSPINQAARLENARALAASIGLDIGAAEELLDVSILVTHNVSNPSSHLLANEIIRLLARTVSNASAEIPAGRVAAEIIVGLSAPRTQAPGIHISGNASSATISLTSHLGNHFEIAHPILCLLSACYVAGVALKIATKNVLPFHIPDPLILDFSQLGIDLNKLDKPILLGKAYLAGAGAIGNGFLWALRHLRVEGELHVVDFDHVEDGNLNRQMWFGVDDIGYPKAERLSIKAQPFLSSLRLVPRQARLQELPERTDGAWLSRLIVAVDSRRARRGLQSEIPGEVFDASTTDIREIVLHYHKQPTTSACLSCIYAGNEQESTREDHIAAHLGVPRLKIQEQTIDEEAARIITTRFSDRFSDHTKLIGIAYDTLFKTLCGQGALKTPEGRQIIAPFAFISVLAGTFLALELVRRLGSDGNDTNFNYWRASPWHPPIGRSRRLISAQDGCEFCGDLTLRDVTRKLWG